MTDREWQYGPDGQDPEPDDLAQIQADDALLDALGGADPNKADELGEAELNSLLLSWRRDVDSESMPELVDTGTAVTTVRTAEMARKHNSGARRWKYLVPVAAAATVLGIAFAGTGIAARDAQPGDALWGVTKVLYADKARSIEVASEVRHDFELARSAISKGELNQARSALDEAKVALDAIVLEEEREELSEQHEELMTQLDEDSDGGNGSTDEDDGDAAPAAAETSESSSSTASSTEQRSSTPVPTTSPEPTESSEPTTTSPAPTSSSTSSTSEQSPRIGTSEPDEDGGDGQQSEDSEE
ncbi:Anti-sigma-D factor RsdA to sigma factor binding region [Haloechinothrix alba]|uniref:Anti-sigma-D factor RsdA to sigma factor binding region n=1 Tax=Haloechinothrix alba TaxID=664784 RepID=A0A238VTA6_9PSEU|nr:anti-sigma-D factor RsdA [Haloechinothrix alba]SNR37387.1 Anti-sigma-D factor RsdA to sigma factor binding region [Haloechinothrix alba]